MCAHARRRRAKHNDYFSDQKVVEVSGKRFADLPLELVTEVFRYLEPGDILYLARTTKGLRAFLLDRHKSYRLWKTVFCNVPDLPPCPDYLSEPAYAQLAFDPICHGCSAKCETIEWELRMRCCPKCLKKMTVFRDCSLFSSSRAIRNALSVRLPIARRHYVLRDCPETGMSVRFQEALVPSHRSSDWEAILKRAKSTRFFKEQFVDQEDKFWSPVIRHASLCLDWELKQLNQRANRLELVRKERVNDIKRNLMNLGWTDDLYYLRTFSRLPEVNKTEPLTPAEWSKISPKLVVSLPTIRLAEIVCMYRDRISRLHYCLPSFVTVADLEAHPQPIDFFLHPDVRSVLEGTTNTDTTLKKLTPILPEVVRRWYDDAVGELLSWTRQQIGSRKNVDPRDVTFHCTHRHCKESTDMSFSMALSHRHLYKNYITRKKRTYARRQESEIYVEIVKEVCKSQLRSLDVLRVSRCAPRRAK